MKFKVVEKNPVSNHCIFCNRNGISQARFVCEECLEKVFGEDTIVMYCRQCENTGSLTHEEFLLIVKGDFPEIKFGDKFLVVSDSCEKCFHKGDETVAEVYHLKSMPEA